MSKYFILLFLTMLAFSVAKADTKETKIRLKFDGKEMIVKLSDNNSTKSLLSSLPMTLKFEDFNSVEKIAYLKGKLPTDDAPEGYDPSTGDLAYYAPWGNLSLFYKDFRYSNSLIHLGVVESGMEYAEMLDDGNDVVIELVK